MRKNGLSNYDFAEPLKVTEYSEVYFSVIFNHKNLQFFKSDFIRRGHTFM